MIQLDDGNFCLIIYNEIDHENPRANAKFISEPFDENGKSIDGQREIIPLGSQKMTTNSEFKCKFYAGKEINANEEIDVNISYYFPTFLYNFKDMDNRYAFMLTPDQISDEVNFYNYDYDKNYPVFCIGTYMGMVENCNIIYVKDDYWYISEFGGFANVWKSKEKVSEITDPIDLTQFTFIDNMWRFWRRISKTN